MLSNPNLLPSKISTFGDGTFCWFLRDLINEGCMSCQEVSLSSSANRAESREFSNIVIIMCKLEVGGNYKRWDDGRLVEVGSVSVCLSLCIIFIKVKLSWPMAGPMARTVPEVRRETKHLPLVRPTLSSWSVSLWPAGTPHYIMYHQTHHPSGRHRHNAVFDWRLLRPGHERPEPSVKQPVDNRQLDYLYSQLEQLKTNMREKQSSLANVSSWGW